MYRYMHKTLHDGELMRSSEGKRAGEMKQTKAKQRGQEINGDEEDKGRKR